MPKSSLLALCAALALGGPALAAELILDYRDPGFRDARAFYSAAETQKVLSTVTSRAPELVRALGERPVIIGSADGSFSRPGARERAYVIEAAPPAAIEPFPKAVAPVLAVIEGDKPVAVLPLAKDTQYQRVAGAADVDGNGTSELMLETTFMNMGQISTALDVVDVGKAREPVVVQTLKEVYFDGCENPRGERSRSASTLTISGGKLVARKYPATCPKPAAR